MPRPVVSKEVPDDPSHDKRRSLFRELYAPLCRYCLSFTADPDVAEDIAQEAFIRLVEQNVDGPGRSMRAWLYRTATRLALDHKKVADNRRRLLASYAPRPAAPFTPDLDMERQERRSRLVMALRALPTRDRQLILLRQEGFSYEEIGAVVGVAKTSIGPLLVRAKKRLRELIIQEDPDEAASF